MRTPDLIDRIIGKNLRRYRMDSNMSMQDVAPRLGITYQQLQKYEKSQNRIPASRLWQLSILYNTPIARFFHQD